ncbi:gamma-glutamyl-gamma-aminobutyrate hydrolase family protein [Bradyrhizobium sp. USDA 3311]
MQFRRLSCNSSHQQAVLPSEAYRTIAVAPYGVIEAIEAVGRNVAKGVQWHPEYGLDKLDGLVWGCFVGAGRKYHLDKAMLGPPSLMTGDTVLGPGVFNFLEDHSSGDGPSIGLTTASEEVTSRRRLSENKRFGCRNGSRTANSHYRGSLPSLPDVAEGRLPFSVGFCARREAQLKKSVAGQRDCPGVARSGIQRTRYEGRVEVERQVFIDETWTGTDMAPLRG